MSGASRIDWEYNEALGLYTNPGKHGATPSRAVDVVPYPIDWNDTKRFHVMAGLVLGIASEMGIELAWGGDWNRNWVYTDQRFHDLPHYELR